MFKWLNKQGVESDQGFVVQFTDRFTCEYIEGNKMVSLYVESGQSGGLPCIILDPDAFVKWDDGTPIEKGYQDQLFENFKDAMEFQDLKMVVQKGE